ncbi:hypothetical protein RclHR1_33310001 [Rhizophagus clarus]|uniref:RRM domain-containing protein n=1 Tax=Rhizophagus clarus TaxID=94130 RepID=A0A2Z6S3F1_9GLOM|nr:hypothetical protein RclHR1_33310001 [Rhizophagus clarus]
MRCLTYHVAYCTIPYRVEFVGSLYFEPFEGSQNIVDFYKAKAWKTYKTKSKDGRTQTTIILYFESQDALLNALEKPSSHKINRTSTPSKKKKEDSKQPAKADKKKNRKEKKKDRKKSKSHNGGNNTSRRFGVIEGDVRPVNERCRWM